MKYFIRYIHAHLGMLKLTVDTFNGLLSLINMLEKDTWIECYMVGAHYGCNDHDIIRTMDLAKWVKVLPEQHK